MCGMPFKRLPTVDGRCVWETLPAALIVLHHPRLARNLTGVIVACSLNMEQRTIYRVYIMFEE